jgi:hypothetical protein
MPLGANQDWNAIYRMGLTKLVHTMTPLANPENSNIVWAGLRTAQMTDDYKVPRPNSVGRIDSPGLFQGTSVQKDPQFII